MSAIIARYCTCGASIKGRINPDSADAGLEAIWDQAHNGKGHAPTDQRTAAAARRKQERQEGARL